MRTSIWVCVYKVTNTINGHLYIGITSRPDVRWREHKRAAAIGNALPLYCAMREFGTDNFTFDVLEWHRQEWTSREREARLIKSLKTYKPYGYNRAKIHQYWSSSSPSQ